MMVRTATMKTMVMMSLAIGSLSACVGALPTVGPISDLSCRDQLEYVDALIVENELRNAEAAPVLGYPFLRANRNSVLMGKQIAVSQVDGQESGTLFDDWIDQMRRLDRQARASEVRNLPIGHAISIEGIDDCANQLAVELTSSSFGSISAAVFVPDDYLDFQRIAGLYPLTAFAAHFGYEGWKRDNLQSFTQPPAVFAKSGFWRRYAAFDQGDGGDGNAITGITRDSFGRLLPASAELERIAQTYAPEFRVREESDSDKIGRPSLASRDAISKVDGAQPAVFYRLSHTYWKNKWYPQIVYTVWFPERPATGMFDVLAGHLDALVWRVTLDHDGVPLVADSIHGCGCYHMFFPAAGLERIKAPEDNDISETAETPAGFLDPATLENPILWVDATSHYLLSVTAKDNAETVSPKTGMELVREEALASIKLEDGSGYASLYDEDGFVPGTDRLERFILWPMGIERPGAMRQWGHHATAFVGRRHFDQTDVIARYFRLQPKP
ncbi:MAG: hypothetical protein KTR23_10325 [Rhodospirillales bacterium]|nr:hypothetical protein [Rhodospirillales bacterium]